MHTGQNDRLVLLVLKNELKLKKKRQSGNLLKSGDILGTDFNRGQKYEFRDCPQETGMSGIYSRSTSQIKLHKF